MNYRPYIFITHLFLVLSISLTAQHNENHVKIDGKITYQGNDLGNAVFKIYREGEEIEKQVTDKDGRFEYFFDMDQVYTLEFSKPTYITKTIELNTYDVPPAEAEFGFEFGGFEVTLLKDHPDLDKSVLEQPVTIIHYSQDIHQFDYDLQYTRQIIDELDQLSERSEELHEQEQEEIAQLNKDYRDAVSGGDRRMTREEYKLAKTRYEKAIELKPEESYPKEQLEKVNEKLAELEKQNAEYNKLVARGDSLQNLGKLAEARQVYGQATYLKSDPDDAEDKLQQVEDKLEEIAEAKEQEAEKRKQKQEKFQSLLAEAKTDLESGSLDEARALASEALTMFPENQEAHGLMEEVEDNIAARKAEKEAGLLAKQQAEEERRREALRKEAMVDSLMEQSDKLVAEGKFELAKAQLVNAKSLAKDESVIQTKIDGVNQKIEQQKQRLRDYQKQMNLASILLNKGDTEHALEKYREIAQNYPDKPDPVEKIAAIEAAQQQKEDERKLAEQREQEAKNQEQAQQFETYLTEGDVLREKQQYTKALEKYRAAASVQPDNQKLQEKINSLEQLIGEKEKQLAANNKKTAPPGTGKIDLENEPQEYTDEFLDQVAREFPEGVTEKVYKQGNSTITKRIVVRGNSGAVYRKVEHSWGGLYYFKNGESVNQFTWDKETVLK